MYKAGVIKSTRETGRKQTNQLIEENNEGERNVYRRIGREKESEKSRKREIDK